MYSGEVLTVRVRASDPVTQAVITDAAGTASFYAPPNDPQDNPSQRTPYLTVPLSFDPVSRYYLANVPTAGWPGGTWWVQGYVSGGAGNYLAWDYSSFALSA